MNIHARPTRGLIGVAVLSCSVLVQAALAQSYEFALAPKDGGLNASVELDVPIAGTLRGNHDPATNPGGTMTRPSLFGSGNHDIPYTATLVGATGEGGIDTQPAGAFTLDVDLAGGQALVADLFIDALNGAAPTIAVTFNILYQTFYTSNPSDFFPGGITIPVPFGQIEVTGLTITQKQGPAVGTLAPLDRSVYALSVLVDVAVALEAEFNGEPIATGSVELPILLAGTLTILDGGEAHLSMDIELDFKETQDGPLGEFEHIPVDLPGPLSGQTVHLLLSGVIQLVTVTMEIDAELAALGTAGVPPCPPVTGDLNSDGVVGVPDLLLLLAAWGPCAECTTEDCPADLTGSCAVGVADLLLLLANWG